MSREILFLSWESPYPAQGGGPLRTLGLLKQLGAVYPVHLLALTSRRLTEPQLAELSQYAHTVTPVPMVGKGARERASVLWLMLQQQMPYHCAVVARSLERTPQAMALIRTYPGVIYASYGQWGTLARRHASANWILDQHNADIQFWQVYSSQAEARTVQWAARVNGWLAKQHYPAIYANVRRVISVCEEDRQLTLQATPSACVDVIENGVDCSEFSPKRAAREPSAPPRLLFTGTSAGRNVTALREFAQTTWPLIKQELPNAELLVAGNFAPRIQTTFRDYPDISFTGRVDDMRPYFDMSDIFISPFRETHGAKLKIAEAMAMAIPIVSTPQGVRGFDLIDGDSVLIADTPEQFAAHCLTLTRTPERRKALGTAARGIALTTIDWQVLGRRLTSIVDDTFRGLAEAPDHPR